MGVLLNRMALLAKEKLEISKVDLGNDEFVYVRQMTGRERDQFEQSLIIETKNENGESIFKPTSQDYRAKLAVCALCNEIGESLLEPGDYEVLSRNMSALRLEKIVDEAQKVNKVSIIEKENIVKNLDADQVGNSNSDSVEN